MEEKHEQAEKFVQFFRNTSVKPEEINPILESKDSSKVKQSGKLFKVFARPNITMEDVRKIGSVEAFVQENNLDREVIEQAEIQVKYSGYIAKEKLNADKLNRLEYVKIPENFDFSRIKSMSYEAREKLKNIQPTSIAQASRISGVSPNDISVLLVYLGR
jgi:tRNA uridine 5-carboxymethylaminomethyl modification enzyme